MATGIVASNIYQNNFASCVTGPPCSEFIQATVNRERSLRKKTSTAMRLPVCAAMSYASPWSASLRFQATGLGARNLRWAEIPSIPGQGRG